MSATRIGAGGKAEGLDCAGLARVREVIVVEGDLLMATAKAILGLQENRVEIDKWRMRLRPTNPDVLARPSGQWDEADLSNRAGVSRAPADSTTISPRSVISSP